MGYGNRNTANVVALRISSGRSEMLAEVKAVLAARLSIIRREGYGTSSDHAADHFRSAIKAVERLEP